VGGVEGGGASTVAVVTQEALEPLLVAEPADRDAHLCLEQAAQVGRAEPHDARQVGQVAGAGVGVEETGGSVDRGMDVDASDDVLAVEERLPGAEQ
jgi:hypothetical protein